MTCGVDLANSAVYTVKIRTKNAVGLWSEWATQTLAVSYTPPAIPIVMLAFDNIRGSITVVATHPEPVAPQPNVAYSDIYRDGVRIATGVVGGYIDYTPASGRVYSYSVVAVGENGTASQSEARSGQITLSCSQLARLNGDWVRLKSNPGRSNNKNMYANSMQFAGRKKAVTQFEFHESDDYMLRFTLRTKEELDQLERIIGSKETLLYRDNRGRRVFGTVPYLNTDDVRMGWYAVSFPFNAVDYNEVV